MMGTGLIAIALMEQVIKWGYRYKMPVSPFYEERIRPDYLDALKLNIGRMMVSMRTVSPMLAIISEAGL